MSDCALSRARPSDRLSVGAIQVFSGAGETAYCAGRRFAPMAIGIGGTYSSVVCVGFMGGGGVKGGGGGGGVCGRKRGTTAKLG